MRSVCHRVVSRHLIHRWTTTNLEQKQTSREKDHSTPVVVVVQSGPSNVDKRCSSGIYHISSISMCRTDDENDDADRTDAHNEGGDNDIDDNNLQQQQQQQQDIIQIIEGRIIRKKKRSHGTEFALQTTQDEKSQVIYVPKQLLKECHPTSLQLQAFIRAKFLIDEEVWCKRRVVSPLTLLECPGEPLAVRTILYNEPNLWHTLRPYNGCDDDENDDDLEAEENEDEIINEKDFSKPNHELVRKLVAGLQRRKMEQPRLRSPHVSRRKLQELELLETSMILEPVIKNYEPLAGETDNNDNDIAGDFEKLNMPSSIQTSTKKDENGTDDVIWNIPSTSPVKTSSSSSSDEGKTDPSSSSSLTTTSRPQSLMHSNRGKLSRIGYLSNKKHPQIKWIIQRLRSSNHHAGMMKTQFRHILDVGGGRGDLAVALAQTYETATITVVDLNESSLVGGQEYATKMGVSNRINWICDDFTSYANQQMTPSESDIPPAKLSSPLSPPDLVVAWHACGDLSDLAMQYARSVGAAFIVCPCCYSKLSKQTVATQFAELQERPDLSRRGMIVANTKRCQKLREPSTDKRDDRQVHPPYCVTLEEYDYSWSSRNQVLVGHCQALE